MSAGTDGSGNYAPDQLRSIEWAKEGELSNFIDLDAPVGIMGYSQGGAATLVNSSDLEAIESANIAAGVVLHPLQAETLKYYVELY